MGAVGEPAFSVNAMTREVTPITRPPSIPVSISCVSASTKTGSRVSASVAELTLMGIRLSMTVSASNSARSAMRLLFFNAILPLSGRADGIYARGCVRAKRPFPGPVKDSTAA